MMTPAPLSTRLLLAAALCLTLPLTAVAQTTATQAAAAATTETDANIPTVPAPRFGKAAKNFSDRHQSHLDRIKEGPIGVLFFGDSITQGWEKQPEIWETAFGQWNPANFGIGGDRTQNLLWRIDHGAFENINPNPKVLVLMIGTNNSNNNKAPEIADGIRLIIQRTREQLPDTKVLLLAVFPREPRKGQTDNPQMEVIKKLNPMLEKMDDGETVFYKDIGHVFLKDGRIPQEIMPDGLHLTKEGYQLWADAVKPEIEKLMQD